VVAGGRDQLRVPALEEEDIGEQADQLQQREGDEGAQDADDERNGRDRDDARVGGEIGELELRTALPERRPTRG
jgi:hypothetical protein